MHKDTQGYDAILGIQTSVMSALGQSHKHVRGRQQELRNSGATGIAA